MIDIPAWFEDAVVGDDAFDVARAGADALADLLYFGMPTAAGADVLDFAVGLVELAEGQPAFGGPDVQQIMGIKRTLPAVNLFHRSQGTGKQGQANGVFTP